MASGFVQRIKGKTQADLVQLGTGGARQFVDFIKLGVVGQSTQVKNNGHTVISSTVGGSGVLTLSAPEAGVEKTITVTTMSSGTFVIKTNSTGVTFLDGVNSFWKPSTTQAAQATLFLLGVSTTQWAYGGITPGATAAGLTPNGGVGLNAAGT